MCLPPQEGLSLRVGSWGLHPQRAWQHPEKWGACRGAGGPQRPSREPGTRGEGQAGLRAPGDAGDPRVVPTAPCHPRGAAGRVPGCRGTHDTPRSLPTPGWTPSPSSSSSSPSSSQPRAGAPAALHQPEPNRAVTGGASPPCVVCRVSCRPPPALRRHPHLLGAELPVQVAGSVVPDEVVQRVPALRPLPA